MAAAVLWRCWQRVCPSGLRCVLLVYRHMNWELWRRHTVEVPHFWLNSLAQSFELGRDPVLHYAFGMVPLKYQLLGVLLRDGPDRFDWTNWRIITHQFMV